MMLIRPTNGIIGAVSVLIGASLANKFSILNPQFSILDITLACLSCFLIISAGNSFNDYCDAEIDSINRPERPIPSGKIRENQALAISIIFSLLGLFSAYLVSPILLSVALAGLFLLFLYSHFLKRRGLIGNVIVAILGGVPFIYGALAVKRFAPALIPFGFAFLFHFTREILKDVEDIKGDRLNNTSSFPMQYGERKAVILAVSILILLILFTFLPFVFGFYGIYYLTAILILNFILIMIAVRLFQNKVPIAQVTHHLKFGMVIGLVALFLSNW